MTLTGTILITGGSGTFSHAIARTARAEGWDCRITVYSRSELRHRDARAAPNAATCWATCAITTAWPPRSPALIRHSRCRDEAHPRGEAHSSEAGYKRRRLANRRGARPGGRRRDRQGILRPTR